MCHSATAHVVFNDISRSGKASRSPYVSIQMSPNYLPHSRWLWLQQRAFRTTHIEQTLSTTLLLFKYTWLCLARFVSRPRQLCMIFAARPGCLSHRIPSDSQNPLVDPIQTLTLTDTRGFACLPRCLCRNRLAPPVSSVPAPSLISIALFGFVCLGGF